jgi:hypothetical protein
MWQNDPEQCLSFAENLPIGPAPGDTLLKYKELEHIKRDWLADPKAPGLEPDARHKLWWPQFYPIHRVFRAAFLKAYDLCWGGASKKKIDFYWICAGSHLEMALCTPAHTDVVTFLILTPTAPIPRHDGDIDMGATEPIWVARFDSAGRDANVVRDPGTGTVTSQLRPEKPK